MTIIQIQRDPFARTTLIRRVLDRHERPATCCTCGSERARFVYQWESDGTRFVRGRGWSRPVCSVDCFRSYYGRMNNP
jgi:hypothetical protein